MPLHVMGGMQTDSKHHQHFWVPVGNCLEFSIGQHKQARPSLHVRAAFSPPFPYFFVVVVVVLEGSPLSRGERPGVLPACLGCFVACGMMHPRSCTHPWPGAESWLDPWLFLSAVGVRCCIEGSFANSIISLIYNSAGLNQIRLWAGMCRESAGT